MDKIDVSVDYVEYPANNDKNVWGDFGWLVKFSIRRAGDTDGKIGALYGRICKHSMQVEILDQKVFDEEVVRSALALGSHQTAIPR